MGDIRKCVLCGEDGDRVNHLCNAIQQIRDTIGKFDIDEHSKECGHRIVISIDLNALIEKLIELGSAARTAQRDRAETLFCKKA